MSLSAHERRIALALAEAALPAGRLLPGGGPETVVRLEAFLDGGGRIWRRPFRAGLWALESAAVPRTGRPFSALPVARRLALLEAWSESSSPRLRQVVRGVLLPVKHAYFDSPDIFARLGCGHGKPAPAQVERRPWMRQVTDGRTATHDLSLTCEVVVVGTGAGGAAAAWELARRGRAVVMVEAGDFRTREHFTGHASDAFQSMYLAAGATFSLGNLAAPVWAGQAVGGATVINSGTCLRLPERTLQDWARQDGLSTLTSASLAPYFARVEAMLQVETAPREHLGGVARVIARGADALGLSHHPLARNAPGCDGQGVCCFGCPTGAKRSTDVSYVPEALKRGAVLLTGATVDHVLSDRGRATGVAGTLASGHTFHIRADATVVAGGALGTPLLLARSGLCGRSGMLGRNLSIHPATKVLAVFDETIDMSVGIPQSYGIDTFADEGILFEGAATPVDVTSLAVPWVGPRFMSVMEDYPRLALYGFMIKDTSRGRVFAGLNRHPVIRYDMNEADAVRMQRGLEILCELYLRAGAARVLPMVPGCPEIRDEADLARLRALRLAPGDFDVAAFHPLGTCRMGTDPRRSCVGPSGEAHDLADLYVTDGSALPSSLGVNPQMTIMALALRSAEHLDARLASPATALTPTEREAPMRELAFAFEETMSGIWRREGTPGDRPFTFFLRARSAPLPRFARRREVAIEGTVDAETLATRQPFTGTLGLDLLLTRSLPYHFTFSGDDGATYTFQGQKMLRATSLTGLKDAFTQLPGEIRDGAGERVGEAHVYFNWRDDLFSFLRSWRLA